MAVKQLSEIGALVRRLDDAGPAGVEQLLRDYAASGPAPSGSTEPDWHAFLCGHAHLLRVPVPGITTGALFAQVVADSINAGSPIGWAARDWLDRHQGAGLRLLDRPAPRIEPAVVGEHVFGDLDTVGVLSDGLVVTVGRGATVTCWDPSSGAMLVAPSAPGPPGQGVVASAAVIGQTVVARESGGLLSVWDARFAEWREGFEWVSDFRPVPGHEDLVMAVTSYFGGASIHRARSFAQVGDVLPSSTQPPGDDLRLRSGWAERTHLGADDELVVDSRHLWLGAAGWTDLPDRVDGVDVLGERLVVGWTRARDLYAGSPAAAGPWSGEPVAQVDGLSRAWAIEPDLIVAATHHGQLVVLEQRPTSALAAGRYTPGWQAATTDWPGRQAGEVVVAVRAAGPHRLVAASAEGTIAIVERSEGTAATAWRSRRVADGPVTVDLMTTLGPAPDGRLRVLSVHHGSARLRLLRLADDTDEAEEISVYLDDSDDDHYTVAENDGPYDPALPAPANAASHELPAGAGDDGSTGVLRAVRRLPTAAGVDVVAWYDGRTRRWDAEGRLSSEHRTGTTYRFDRGWLVGEHLDGAVELWRPRPPSERRATPPPFEAAPPEDPALAWRVATSPAGEGVTWTSPTGAGPDFPLWRWDLSVPDLRLPPEVGPTDGGRALVGDGLIVRLTGTASRLAVSMWSMDTGRCVGATSLATDASPSLHHDRARIIGERHDQLLIDSDTGYYRYALPAIARAVGPKAPPMTSGDAGAPPNVHSAAIAALGRSPRTAGD